MGNCLITKFKGTVNNNNLQTFNSYRFNYRGLGYAEGQRCIVVNCREAVKFVSNNNIRVRDTVGHDITVKSGSFVGIAYLLLPDTDGYIDIIGKYGFGQLLRPSGSYGINYDQTLPVSYTIDAKQLSYNQMSWLLFPNGVLQGMIDFKYAPSIASMGFPTTSALNYPCGINLDSLKEVTTLTYITFNNTKQTKGSIESLGKSISMEGLQLYSVPNATGDFATLCDVQVTNGRTSGLFTLNTGQADDILTFRGERLTAAKIKEINNSNVSDKIKVEFGTSFQGGWRISQIA